MIDLQQRLTMLESQLVQQTKRREQARAIMRESIVAIHQIEGAIAVVRDLLLPNEDVPHITENGDG